LDARLVRNRHLHSNAFDDLDGDFDPFIDGKRDRDIYALFDVESHPFLDIDRNRDTDVVLHGHLASDGQPDLDGNSDRFLDADLDPHGFPDTDFFTHICFDRYFNPDAESYADRIHDGDAYTVTDIDDFGDHDRDTDTDVDFHDDKYIDPDFDSIRNNHSIDYSHRFVHIQYDKDGHPHIHSDPDAHPGTFADRDADFSRDTHLRRMSPGCIRALSQPGFPFE
jgi:hypothetical protein